MREETAESEREERRDQGGAFERKQKLLNTGVHALWVKRQLVGMKKIGIPVVQSWVDLQYMSKVRDY